MRALAWKWYMRLRQRGKEPSEFVVRFCRLLARAVNHGRRVTGMAKAKDVMTSATQRRHGFKIESLPNSTLARYDRLYTAPYGQRLHDAFEERLRDNTITPVPDQVAFRVDFPAWLARLTARKRRIVRQMAHNERTLDIGRHFELSPARISRMRRELHDDWQRFCGERNAVGAVRS